MNALKPSIGNGPGGPTADCYEFGPFRLDCRTRELWRDDEVVALKPKAFDLLRVLVTSADRIVEKNDLLQLVWPNSFVSDDSLTQNIATLRKALGDSPDRPQYILTVPRHGYRFIAAVRAVLDKTGGFTESEAPVEPPAARLSGSTASNWWIRAVLVTSAVALLIATVVEIAVLRRAPSSTPVVTRFIVAPPERTTFSPSASLLAVSPNGRLLAFLASRPGEETRIWVRSLDSLVAHELTGTDGALSPFWSPDSQNVGFAAHGQLKTVSLLGEPPRILCDLQVGVAPSATWNHDGVILFSQGNSIFRIAWTGGTPAPVTSVDPRRGETAHLLPQFLPDGRHFIYMARGEPGGSINSWIVLGSLDTSEHRQLIPASSQALYADPGYLLFLSDGALFAQPFDASRLQLQGAPLAIADADHVGFNSSGIPRGMFSVSQTGVLAYRTSTMAELGWFDRAGRPLGWIGAAGRDSHPALSPDGQRVAVSRYDPSTSTRNIWILDLARGGVASPFTSHLTWAWCPVWSSDGTRIVFASTTTTGNGELYEKSFKDTTEERALPYHMDGCPLDWSRDDQYLLYGTTRGVAWGSGLSFFRLADKAEPTPLDGPWPRSRSWARISPNGRWMAYVSDTSGRNEIYVRSFPVGSVRPWQVSSRGGIEPQWRGDGRELFFIGADKQLMAVPVTTEGGFRIGTPAALFLTGLDPSGLGITGRNQYVVTSDGARFLINEPRPDAAPPPVSMLLNWTATLKK